MSTKKPYTSGVVRRTLADGHPFTAPPSLEISKQQGILSKKEFQCAKYSCSGQVKAALSSIHLLHAIRDLGFCKSTPVLAGMLESQMLPKVPRTGIFCTLGRKKRQHATDKSKCRRRITNTPQLGIKIRSARNASDSIVDTSWAIYQKGEKDPVPF